MHSAQMPVLSARAAKGVSMLGIIGGTGLYKIDGISNVSRKVWTHPLGPSLLKLPLGKSLGVKSPFYQGTVLVIRSCHQK